MFGLKLVRLRIIKLKSYELHQKVSQSKKSLSIMASNKFSRIGSVRGVSK